MEYFHSHPKRFAESISAYRHDHKFLKIDFVIGMRATVEDIHQRNRKGIGIHASNIPVKRLMRFLSRRLSHSHGHAQNSISAYLSLIRSPVHEIGRAHV